MSQRDKIYNRAVRDVADHPPYEKLTDEGLERLKQYVELPPLGRLVMMIKTLGFVIRYLEDLGAPQDVVSILTGLMIDLEDHALGVKTETLDPKSLGVRRTSRRSQRREFSLVMAVACVDILRERDGLSLDNAANDITKRYRGPSPIPLDALPGRQSSSPAKRLLTFRRHLRSNDARYAALRPAYDALVRDPMLRQLTKQQMREGLASLLGANPQPSKL